MANQASPIVQPNDSELDIVQHPTLGTLKFPKSMPISERNKSIEQMEQSNTVSVGGNPVNLKTGQGGVEAATAQAQKIGSTLPVDKKDMSQPHTNPPGLSFGYSDQPLFRKALEHGKGNAMAKDVVTAGISAAAPELIPELGGAGLGGALTRIGVRALASGAGAGVGNVIGQGAFQGKNPFTSSGMKEAGDNALSYGIGGGLSDAIGEGLGAVAKSKPFQGIINRSMGAQPKDALFASPAKALLDNDVLSPTTAGRLKSVNGLLQKAAPQLNTTLAASTKALDFGKLVDEPINDGVNKILESAMTAEEKSAAIHQLEGLRDTLKNKQTLGSGTNINQAPKPNAQTPFDVNRAKQMIGNEVNWTKREPAFPDTVEKTYKSVYSNLKNAVNDAVPGTADLNEQLANLSAAKNSLSRLSSREAVGRGEMAGFGTVGKLESAAGRIAPMGLRAVGQTTPFARFGLPQLIRKKENK